LERKWIVDHFSGSAWAEKHYYTLLVTRVVVLVNY